jgi:hypothetical protein
MLRPVIILAELAAGTLRRCGLVRRPSGSIEAENLFLNRQPAFCRGESYAVHANPIPGGLRHEYALAPVGKWLNFCGLQPFPSLLTPCEDYSD